MFAALYWEFDMKTCTFGLLIALAFCSAGFAEEKPDQQELFKQFEETLSGATLAGHFTVTGKPTDKLRKEEYKITGVTKLEEGDYWLFKTRIKYGSHDVEVPIALEVKWAGSTPVITLDEIKIPALGTFSARVAIDGDKYAGTWTHGKVGGHLFGDIVKPDAEETKEESE